MHPTDAIQLKRTVRFCINPDGSTAGDDSAAGKPSPSGFCRYYELTLAVQGPPDPTTGYLIGIQEIDKLVRTQLLPIIASQINTDPVSNPAKLLPALWERAQSHLEPQLVEIIWDLTPYHTITMNNPKADNYLYQQHFEFAAAHRLHTPDLTDQENADFFGKCNNPSGHGHNYKLKPTIRIPFNDSESIQFQIEQAVKNTILDPLDHKFLNTDCPAFDQSKDGVIPSVENITKHCYESLKPAIDELGCELVNLTVWETDRTCATYPA
jgi:6-pyruvoyltetrahydropterin/6-carboxytetrahydropterin synthase